MAKLPTFKLAMFRKPLGTAGLACWVKCWVTLRQIFIMPRVAMKGGSLP